MAPSCGNDPPVHRCDLLGSHLQTGREGLHGYRFRRELPGAGCVAAVLRDLSGGNDEVRVAREAGTKCPQVLQGTHCIASPRLGHGRRLQSLLLGGVFIVQRFY